MQNQPLPDPVNTVGNELSYQSGLISDVYDPGSLDKDAKSLDPVAQYLPPKQTLGRKIRLAIMVLVGLITIAGTIYVLTQRSSRTQTRAGSFGIVSIPLDQLAPTDNTVAPAESLKVSGKLKVTNSVLLSPTAKPVNPVSGQLYYDQTSNQLAYYNGTRFISTGGTVNNVTNNNTTVTNVLSGSGSGVQLQSAFPGNRQTGNFNVSGIGGIGTLRTTIVDSNGGTLYVNPVSATIQQQIAAGTPATIGLTSGSASAPGPGWSNDLSATKVTLGGVGGTAKSISAFFSGGTGSGHVQVAIYDDDGNVPSRPSNLLATSAVANLVPNGTTTVTIPAITLDANTTYWLAVNTDDNTVGRTYNGGNKSSCFRSSGFGFMPDPIGGCFFDNSDYTISLNYITGGGTSGTLSKASLVVGPSGQILFQNGADSTTAFQIQNAAGTTPLFNVDTINGRIGIGKTTPTSKLDIAGGDINLSNGHSLKFGALQALSASSDGSVTTLSNFVSGGSISAQADTFVIQDANAANTLLRVDANSLQIHIGSGTPSGTPTVLYLADKNTSGDPSGAEGGTYYNSTLGSFRCFYSGFWHNCADIEPQHSFTQYDEFLGGQPSFAGQIGSLGWNPVAIGANGSLALNPATPTPTADRPGILRLRTPAVANQGSTLMLGDTNGSMILSKDNDLKTAVAVGAASNLVLRVGLHNETNTTTQPVSGVWWEADPSSNPNWQYCYGDGSTATCAASTVAITANSWVTLEIRVTATGNGTSAATFVVNNIPQSVSGATIDTTNLVAPAMTCFATSASAQDCYWDYFQLTGTTSTRR